MFCIDGSGSHLDGGGHGAAVSCLGVVTESEVGCSRQQLRSAQAIGQQARATSNSRAGPVSDWRREYTQLDTMINPTYLAQRTRSCMPVSALPIGDLPLTLHPQRSTGPMRRSES